MLHNIFTINCKFLDDYHEISGGGRPEELRKDFLPSHRGRNALLLHAALGGEILKYTCIDENVIKFTQFVKKKKGQEAAKGTASH